MGKICFPASVSRITRISWAVPLSLYHRLSAQPRRACASTCGSTSEVITTTLIWGNACRMRLPAASPECLWAVITSISTRSMFFEHSFSASKASRTVAARQKSPSAERQLIKCF